MSRDLRKRRGPRSVGPPIYYAFNQSTGTLNAHPVDCFRRVEGLTRHARIDVRPFGRIMVGEKCSLCKINPGGRLDTKDIIGRDNEIDRYWRVLQRQGLVLAAERRIGKTHILFKMREECKSGYVPFYQDLEAVHSIADLIRSIYRTVQQSWGDRSPMSRPSSPNGPPYCPTRSAESTCRLQMEVGRLSSPRRSTILSTLPTTTHASSCCGSSSRSCSTTSNAGRDKIRPSNCWTTCAPCGLPGPTVCASCSPVPSVFISSFDPCGEAGNTNDCGKRHAVPDGAAHGPPRYLRTCRSIASRDPRRPGAHPPSSL